MNINTKIYYERELLERINVQGLKTKEEKIVDSKQRFFLVRNFKLYFSPRNTFNINNY